MYEMLSAYILGAVLAWMTCYPAKYLSPERERAFFTVIMLFVAAGFIGFPLEKSDTQGVIHELVAMAVFFGGVALSRFWLMFLPLTFLAHGSWDLMYLLGSVHSVKPDWIVELCVPYDWFVATYLFSRVSRWA